MYAERLLERVVWRPQPGLQQRVIDCPVPEVLVGGSRGSGKTDACLAKLAIVALRYGASCNALVVRPEMPQQDDLIERAKALYMPMGAGYLAAQTMFRFPGGARIRFRPLGGEDDASKYQGQNVTHVVVEEAGNYPDPAPIDRLFGALRSAEGIPVQMLLTANPGGPGHHWIRERYVTPYPQGGKLIRVKLPDGSEHLRTYIRGTIATDNRILLERDPQYISRLHLVGSPELVRAWLDGDWDVHLGAFFDRWSQRMILRPVELPAHWPRYRSLDWGFATPFSVGWWRYAEEDFPAESLAGPVVIPKGSLVRYREWYGVATTPGGEVQPNVGARLDAEQVADGILKREMGERVSWGVADPSLWATSSGPSPAERMATYRPRWAPRREPEALFRKADNRRVAQKGLLGGWDQLRARMRGIETKDGMMPLIYCFSTCVDSIRTIPALQHDPRRPEDVDTRGEDHCFAAGTPVQIEGLGTIAIAEAPESGRVMTRFGWKPYHGRRKTRAMARTVLLRFDDGRELICTPDHLLATADGWVRAEDFENEWSYTLWTPRSSARRARSFRASATISAAATFSAAASVCIGWYGRLRMALSRLGTMCTTLTAIEQTTLSGTSCSCLPRPTSGTTTPRDPSVPLNELRASGMVPMRGGGGIRSTSTSTSGRGWRLGSLLRAWNAAARTFALLRERSRADSVPVPVKPARCVAVVPAAPQDVYCLTVPEVGEFVANGLAVGNCADEWRYMCMARPMSEAKPPPKPRLPPLHVRNIFEDESKPKSRYRW